MNLVGRSLLRQVPRNSRSLLQPFRPTTAVCTSFVRTNSPGLGGFGLRGFATVKITFVDADGDSETVDAQVGSSLLEVCHDNDIEVEGACGGEMACSTCHMILDEETYASLPEKEEEEEDMLDLALGLTETSRLGCQVIVTESMDGITVRLPAETSNQLG